MTADPTTPTLQAIDAPGFAMTHGRWVVWLSQTGNRASICTGATLARALDAARSHLHLSDARVTSVEDPHGRIVDKELWITSLDSTYPLPYIYTLELREHANKSGRHSVATLWTTTDLNEAAEWRNSLPPLVRARILIVSNTADDR